MVYQVIPKLIEDIIQERDAQSSNVNFMEIYQAVGAARSKLLDVPEEVQRMAWSEVLAFALQTDPQNRGPWGCYFKPLMTGEREDGAVVYSPDIADASPEFIDHYADRARTLVHPVLKARYADLAWELAPMIDKTRRDIEMARLAIDSYLASPERALQAKHRDRLEWSIRAFHLASRIGDEDLRSTARAQLLALQDEAVACGKGWWRVFDCLVLDRKSGVTDDEEHALVAGLEGLLVRFSDIENPESFNAHRSQRVAERLIRYYRRKRRGDDVRRLYEMVGRSFEHHASNDDSAMRAGTFLQTAVNAYREARLIGDSARARRLMEEKIAGSPAEMAPITTTVEIPRKDVEKFCDGLVVDDLGQSFVNFAVEFLTIREDLETRMRQSAEDAPIFSTMSMQLIAENRIAGSVGPLEEDCLGRTICQATMEHRLWQFWMHHALRRLFEVHDPPPEAFVAWANRSAIFDDVTFLIEGVRAWHEGDLPKAVHLLIPQIEYGLRKVAVELGCAETKGHPSIQNTSVVISMGDILYNKTMQARLGPNLVLYFLSFYADPRGWNLRNELAHGLLKPEQVSEQMVHLTVHSLIVLGLWREIASRDTK